MNQPNDPNSQEKRFSAEELDRIMAEAGAEGSDSPDANEAQERSRKQPEQQRSTPPEQPPESTVSSKPPIEPADGDPRGKHTSLQCLSLLARHHGIDVSADRLIHEYSLEFDEPSLKRVLRIGKDTGLKVRHARLTWKQLTNLNEAFPAMARLENGNYVIVVGMRDNDEDGNTVQQVAVFDPLGSEEGFIFLSREQFERSWKGEVILAKKTTSLLKQKQKFSLRWFIPEVIREWRSFRDVGVAALCIHLIALIVPLYFQIVIDKVLTNNAQSTLQVLTIGICIALVFDAVLGFLRSYLLLYATSKIDVRVATRTFGHLMRLPLNFFEQITAGVLTKHMQQTSQIREFLTGSLFLTALDSTALFIFIPILLYYSVPLTIIVLLFAAMLGVNIGVLLIPYRTRLEALYHAEGERQAMLVETIHGIQTVKALSMEPVQRKHWDNSSAQAVAMHFRVGKISIAATTISKLLEKLLTVTIVWYGANLVLGSKSLSVGELVAFQMISGRVTGPLVQLVSLVHSYQQCALSVRMLGTVMNRDEEPGIGRGLRPVIDGEMQCEGITFRYNPSAAPALDDVTFTIPKGKITGLVGRSGSGKTTLTRMIQGMHQPQSGLIRIDKLDMRELDISHVRQNIGVVLQDNFLFRGSIRDNIAMAKTNASFQEVVYVARLAGAAEFIERMPQSYDTMLEENGSNLSGGQKQRLAIARALLKDPRILIFDEATSALDPESEGIIQRNLKRIAKGRTVIIVSHRLTTLTECDQIIVMERGRIEMIGTHQQLLKSCKVYSDLWHQQTGAV